MSNLYKIVNLHLSCSCKLYHDTTTVIQHFESKIIGKHKLFL